MKYFRKLTNGTLVEIERKKQKHFKNLLNVEIVELKKLGDVTSKSRYKMVNGEIVIDGELMDRNLEKDLLARISEEFKSKMNAAYELIAGTKSSKELEDFYASKLWSAEIVSERDKSGNNQTARKRGITSEALLAQASFELNIAYSLHREDRAKAGVEPESDLVAYANYICDQANFWKQAKGALNLVIGTTTAKLNSMVNRGELEEAEQLLAFVSNIKASEDATTKKEKLESILAQVEGLFDA